MTDAPPVALLCSLGPIWSPRACTSRQLSLGLAWRRSIRPWQVQRLNSFGCRNSVCFSLGHPYSGVTILGPRTYQPTQSFMHVPSILRLTFILFGNGSCVKLWIFASLDLKIRLQMVSPNLYRNNSSEFLDTILTLLYLVKIEGGC